MKTIYNPESNEITNKIVNGNPNGIANFVKPSRQIYKTIFETMLANFWNPATVNITEDKRAVKLLSDDEYRAYELTFGKLIFNDSIVTNRLMDNVNPIITDTIANACIALQSGQEATHSYSYAFIGDDILGSTEIYDLFKTDAKLLELTKRINSRYSVFDDGKDLSDGAKSLVAIANLILEGISFPAGFVVVWSLGNKMQGSANMITEISRDELNTHLPLYVNIYKHIKEDTGVNLDSVAKEWIERAVEDEIEFLRYSTNGVMGFNTTSIRDFMYWIGDNRLRELGIKSDYKYNKNDGLIKVFKSYSEHNLTKGNFFETNVSAYSKQALDMEF